jgi:SPP1 gp7 family putative phage head morphogenesis protein
MPETRLALAPGGLFARALSALGLVQEAPELPPSGAQGVTGPDVEPLHQMSAYAAFAFVQACITVRVNDLQSLPWYIQVGPEDDGQRIDEHPLLDILREPNNWDDGRWLHGQAQADQLLTGNAYLLRTGKGLLAQYHRIHPQGVQVEYDRYYRPVAYSTSEGEAFAADAVVHHRRLSWQDRGKANIGTGVIQALNRRLVALKEGEALQAKQARMGKKDAVMTPQSVAGVKATWSSRQVSQLVSGIMASLMKGSPYMVLGEPMDVTVLSATAEELGFTALDKATREDIMAILQVPPVKLGLDATNFATAREQRREYWSSLISESRWHEDTWTREGRRAFGLDRNARVRRDFSDVEALQADQVEAASIASTRAMAAQTYKFMGYSTQTAMRLAGHEDPPAPDAPEPEPMADPAPRSMRRDLPATEEERAELWERRVKQRQDPAADRIEDVMGAFLAEQADRLAAELEAERSLGQRSIASLLGRLLGGAELGRLLAALRRALTPEYLRAYQAAASEVGAELTSPDGEDASRMAAAAAQQIHQYTSQQVRDLIEQGLEDGLSLPEIAQQLRERPHAFSTTRANAIARTEATRVTERATMRAYQAAETVGVRVKVRWLSARDGVRVRDAHRRLDGKAVDPGGWFYIDGHRAQHPGGFGVPELDINCRCTTVPEVVSEP